MKNIFLLMLVLWSSSTMAKIINVEFNFTPFLGNPATADHVKTVPGKARVFLNNVLVAEQDIDQSDKPVLFDTKEVAAAVWVPVQSLGAAVRKGKNTLKVEFEPSSLTTGYQARLSWAEVRDQSSEEFVDGVYKASNQTGEGRENKEAQGKIVFEKDFVADFATDLAWHHYPPVTDLDDADKQQLLALINSRVALFQPKFDGVYKLLETTSRPGIKFDLVSLHKKKCLEKAYAAGVRIPVRNAADLNFVLTGNPEVVIKGKAGSLFSFDQKTFARIKDEDMQMCAGMVLSVVYPPQLVVVKNASGVWEVVY